MIPRSVLSLKFSYIIDRLGSRRFIPRLDDGRPRNRADADQQADNSDHNHQFYKVKPALIFQTPS